MAPAVYLELPPAKSGPAFSMTRTLQPFSRAAMAAQRAALPDPTTMTVDLCGMSTLLRAGPGSGPLDGPKEQVGKFDNVLCAGTVRVLFRVVDRDTCPDAST